MLSNVSMLFMRKIDLSRQKTPWCPIHKCTPDKCGSKHDVPHQMEWAIEHIQEVLDEAARRGIKIIARYTVDAHIPPSIEILHKK
jgi:hypothetical protein